MIYQRRVECCRVHSLDGRGCCGNDGRDARRVVVLLTLFSTHGWWVVCGWYTIPLCLGAPLAKLANVAEDRVVASTGLVKKFRGRLNAVGCCPQEFISSRQEGVTASCCFARICCCFSIVWLLLRNFPAFYYVSLQWLLWFVIHCLGAFLKWLHFFLN